MTPATVAAFFIVTDPETTPASLGGKQCFAFLTGVLFIVAIAKLGRPEAGLYLLLVTNACVPYIDRLVGARANKGRR